MCGVGETEFDGLFLDRCAHFYVLYVVTCEPHDASSEDSDGGLLKCVFCDSCSHGMYHFQFLGAG